MNKNKKYYIFIFLLAVLYIASYFAPHSLLEKSGDYMESPSFDHLFGTDKTGRDLLSLILIGFRGSLVIGVSAGITAVVIAIIMAFLFSKIKSVSRYISDIFILFPLTLPLLAFGERINTPIKIGIFIGVFSWSQLYGSLVKQLEEINSKEFIKRLYSKKISKFFVSFKAISPLVIPTLCSYFVNIFTIAIVVDSIISFVGGGITPPNISWGVLLSNSNFASDSWYLVFFPVMAITLLTIYCLAIVRDIEKDWLESN